MLCACNVIHKKFRHMSQFQIDILESHKPARVAVRQAAISGLLPAVLFLFFTSDIQLQGFVMYGKVSGPVISAHAFLNFAVSQINLLCIFAPDVWA